MRLSTSFNNPEGKLVYSYFPPQMLKDVERRMRFSASFGDLKDASLKDDKDPQHMRKPGAQAAFIKKLGLLVRIRRTAFA